MKNLIATLLLCLTGMVSVALLGFSVEEIAEKYGSEYEVGYTDDSTFYLFYPNLKLSKDKTCPMFAYFTTDKKDGLCFAKKLIFPIGELNKKIAEYNEKYVKESELMWNDYKKGIIYIISIHRDINLFSVLSFFKKE